MAVLEEGGQLEGPSPDDAPGQHQIPPRSTRLELVGLCWVVVAGVAVLAPALIHGVYLGPFNLLTLYGTPGAHGGSAENVYFNDQLSAIMPWTVLATSQVHHGLLPLWNSYGGLGSPLAFNWQSAVFSFPALVGYLVPAHLSYTVTIVVTVIVAGTGSYVFARLLGVGVVGAAMAGTVFELSGPFIGWLGWPHAAVISWAGWLFAATLLIIRGGHRARVIAGFALVLAFAVYAGQPEILALLLVSLAVFVLVLLIHRAVSDGPRQVVRPIVDLAIGSVAGGALAAPLALPGLQLGSGSVHRAAVATPALPAHDLSYLIFSGFDGLPVPGSKMFGPWGLVYIGGYIGIIAIILAFVAIVLRRRSPEVMALAAVAVVTGGIAFASIVPSLNSVVNRVPTVGLSPARFLLATAFALAMLAGVGADALLRASRLRVWGWIGLAFGGAGILVIGIYILSIGHLPAVENRIRSDSFVWPTAQVLVGVICAGVVVVMGTRRSGDPDPTRNVKPRSPGAILSSSAQVAGRWAVVVLLICQTAFLISAGAPLLQSSAEFYPSNPATTTLQRTVGSSLVGFGRPTFLCVGLGIPANINDVYAVHELALYDPMIPNSYFTPPSGHSHMFVGFPAENTYCPALATVSEAQLYGVSYVLEPAGKPGPIGTSYVARIGVDDLYRVPRAYQATLVPQGQDASTSEQSQATPVAVTKPSPTEWTMRVNSATTRTLVLRLSDVPGWRATIDGQPLTLQSSSGIMLAATIPAGRHSIVLHYWPESFTAGIFLALCSAISLLTAMFIERRRRPTRTAAATSVEAPTSGGE